MKFCQSLENLLTETQHMFRLVPQQLILQNYTQFTVFKDSVNVIPPNVIESATDVMNSFFTKGIQECFQLLNSRWQKRINTQV